MIGYNNEAPKAVNNVGQFGATEGSIGAYKSAAEYASDAKYWALLSQTKYSSVEEILAEVERLYAQGRLLEEDIKQLKNDFEAQEQILLGLIQSTGEAIDNTNAATELSKEATQEVLEQLDIISNMTVQTTLLPPGSLATGSYDNATGVFSFGIPEGQPGRDGTDGTISDIGMVPVGVPVVDDYGFYVDKDDGGLYRADMSDIANLIPSVRSVSINGGTEQTGSVVFDSVSTFNGRKGAVVSQSGDYTAAQVGAFSVSNNLSEITNTSQAIKNIGLANYGIATASLVKLSSFDWQTFVFTNSARYYVDYSAMTNRPEGLTYSSDTGLFVEVIGVAGSALEVRIVPFTVTNEKYVTYAVRASGAIGSRTFIVREELSSALPVTISQGGTGATTAANARTNLGLGLVATESIVPITKGGTGSTSAENARLALVAAKSGSNSDITSFTNKVSFTQPVNIPDATVDTESASLGQVKKSIEVLDTVDGLSKIGSGFYSDIRSYSGVGDKIFCKGRTSAEDGCSGVFFLDPTDTSSLDNDGTVLVSVSGSRWKRQFDGVAQRRWFGLPDDEGITSGWDQDMPVAEASLKSAKQDIAITPDDVTIKHRAIKTFRRASGIKDSACSAAFIIGDFPPNSDVEPSASVTGFNSYSEIGKYPGRDSVALFAQAESARPYYFGDGVFYSDTLTSEEVKGFIDEIEPGMILDVNFGTPEWKGTVILDINKTTGVLTTSGWVKVDGTSAPTTPPPQNSAAYINRHNNLWAANFNALTTQNGGANQAIGIETGLSLLKEGSGNGSKAYYAVNLNSGVGENPEFAFVNAGRFRKGFTAINSTEVSFRSQNLVGESAKHCEFLSESGSPVFSVGLSGIESCAVSYLVASSSLVVPTEVPLVIATAPDINLNLGPATNFKGYLKKVRNLTGGSISVNGAITQGPNVYSEYLSDGNTWIQLFSV